MCIRDRNKGTTDLLGAASINSTGTYVAFILQNPSKFPEAYISSLNNYSPVRITNINAENASKPLPKTELIKWKGADGKEIEGLLTYPINCLLYTSDAADERSSVDLGG